MEKKGYGTGKRAKREIGKPLMVINIKTGNPRYSGDGSFLAYNLSQIKPDVLVALYSEEKVRGGAGI